MDIFSSSSIPLRRPFSRPYTIKCSRTVRCESIAVNWGQTPSEDLATVGCRRTDLPCILMSPESGNNSPPGQPVKSYTIARAMLDVRIILKVVVFPAPFGPKSAKIESFCTAKLTSLTALLADPAYALETCERSSGGWRSSAVHASLRTFRGIDSTLPLDLAVDFLNVRCELDSIQINTTRRMSEYAQR